MERYPDLVETIERPAHITEAEYVRMCDADVFEPYHVELVRGVLERMAPPGLEHARSFGPVFAQLWALMPRDRYEVLADVRTRFEADFIRAPDVVVARRPIGGDTVPVASVLLAVEIADSSRAYDLGPKQSDYARAGIPHYWVVDLVDRVTHVMSDPGPDGYGAISRVPFGDALPVPEVDGVVRLEGAPAQFASK